MGQIVQERSSVVVSVLQFHFPMEPHIVLPQTSETSSFRPCHGALALAFASSPLAFIVCLFVLSAVTARNTVNILHSAETAWSSIFEVTSKLISIFEIDRPQTKSRSHTDITYW